MRAPPRHERTQSPLVSLHRPAFSTYLHRSTRDEAPIDRAGVRKLSGEDARGTSLPRTPPLCPAPLHCSSRAGADKKKYLEKTNSPSNTMCRNCQSRAPQAGSLETAPLLARLQATAALRCTAAEQRQEKNSKKKLTNRGSRDESQRIAAWKLLYRVRHPGPCVSRLQTIPHSDVGSSRDLDPKETGSLLCRGPQLKATPRSPWTPLPADSATALQPECRAKPPRTEIRDGVK